MYLLSLIRKYIYRLYIYEYDFRKDFNSRFLKSNSRGFEPSSANVQAFNHNQQILSYIYIYSYCCDKYCKAFAVQLKTSKGKKIRALNNFKIIPNSHFIFPFLGSDLPNRDCREWQFFDTQAVHYTLNLFHIAFSWNRY